jgi:hypothetical protein
LTPLLLGCDFSSSPSQKKSIVLAHGGMSAGVVQLSKLEYFQTLDAWQNALCSLPQWLGAFDLPFGLPRELVEHLGWPTDWPGCIAHYAALSRAEIRDTFKAFCGARPVGGKFAHRATDGPAGSSPSMKWVNPPVAYMLHAGLPRLLQTGAHFPGLQPAPGGDGVSATVAPDRVALEAYPGLLARDVLGQRSYKSDDSAKHTPDRLIARKDLITALELGTISLNAPSAQTSRQTKTPTPTLRLRLTASQRDSLIADASGDSLDAVLCLVQAAWARRCWVHGGAHYGLPANVDPLEGWILTA